MDFLGKQKYLAYHNLLENWYSVLLFRKRKKIWFVEFIFILLHKENYSRISEGRGILAILLVIIFCHFRAKKNNDILKFTLENDSFCNKKNLPFNSKKVERSSGVTHLRVKVSRWPIKPGPTQPRP